MARMGRPSAASQFEPRRHTSEVAHLHLVARRICKGTFGQVTAGTGSNGNPFAIKRLNKPREEQLSAHRKMMSHIGKHVRVVWTVPPLAH
jgi:hypothetical protein